MGANNRSGGIRLNTKNKWIYNSTEDFQYIKDRNNMLKENGNGWWISNDRILSKNKGFKKGVK